MRPEVEYVQNQHMERVAQALRRNRMLATCVSSAAEVPGILASLIAAGETAASGRSATLEECGAMDFLRNGPCRYLDRHAAVTDEEKRETARDIAVADWFLASPNAVTEDGELYFVDGHASRIAPIAFGPTHVILVAGYNKIVTDLQQAKLRVERIAAPANARRQNSPTPCTITGTCQHCHAPDRICCDTLILSQQRIADRIHVILVGESLGY